MNNELTPITMGYKKLNLDKNTKIHEKSFLFSINFSNTLPNSPSTFLSEFRDKHESYKPEQIS